MSTKFYILFIKNNSVPFLRFKDSFFLDEPSGERAREVLQRLVEEELVAMGPNNNEAPQNNEGGDAEPGEDGNSSILSSLRKRIRLGRERHMEVGILALTHCVIHRVPLKLSFQGYWLNFSVDH